jgi:hypothetical protein
MVTDIGSRLPLCFQYDDKRPATQIGLPAAQPVSGGFRVIIAVRSDPNERDLTADALYNPGERRAFSPMVLVFSILSRAKAKA